MEAFSPLQPGELDYIEKYRSDMVDLPAGAAIIPEHRTSARLFTLYSGWAFRYKTLSDGRRQILNFLLPGDFHRPAGGICRWRHAGRGGRDARAPVRVCARRPVAAVS
jgi:hypothetical protein